MWVFNLGIKFRSVLYTERRSIVTHCFRYPIVRKLIQYEYFEEQSTDLVLEEDYRTSFSDGPTFSDTGVPFFDTLGGRRLSPGLVPVVLLPLESECRTSLTSDGC